MGEDGVAQLQVAIDGGPPSPFLVKGVAYSPTPIGYDTRTASDLGDLFWDSPQPQHFADWSPVWRRDIDAIRTAGFNAIRVYNLMSYHLVFDEAGQVVDPARIPDPDSGWFRYRHRAFLDALWNDGDDPIYVLVGVPLPETIWLKALYDRRADDPATAAVIRFWEGNLTAIAEEVGHHPAVLGFVLFNEHNTPAVHATPEAAAHFWDRVDTYSRRVESLAPEKLIGWASADDGGDFIRRNRDHLLEHATAIDFFGVNTYQTQDLEPALGAYRRAALGPAARPVILTEFGMPATGRHRTGTMQPYREPALSDCRRRIASAHDIPAADLVPDGAPDLRVSTPQSAASLYADPDTHEAAAAVVRRVLPQAFTHPTAVGAMYFEWSDEWWKQPPDAAFLRQSGHPRDEGGPQVFHCLPTTAQTREGGRPWAVLPNGHLDEEGFGLHGIALDGRRADQVYSDQPWKGPAANNRPDMLTVRPALMDAVRETYRQAAELRSGATSADQTP